MIFVVKISREDGPNDVLEDFFGPFITHYAAKAWAKNQFPGTEYTRHCSIIELYPPKNQNVIPPKKSPQQYLEAALENSTLQKIADLQIELDNCKLQVQHLTNLVHMGYKIEDPRG